MLFDIKNKSKLNYIWLGPKHVQNKKLLIQGLLQADPQTINLIGLKENVEQAKVLLDSLINTFNEHKSQRSQHSFYKANIKTPRVYNKGQPKHATPNSF